MPPYWRAVKMHADHFRNENVCKQGQCFWDLVSDAQMIFTSGLGRQQRLLFDHALGRIVNKTEQVRSNPSTPWYRIKPRIQEELMSICLLYDLTLSLAWSFNKHPSSSRRRVYRWSLCNKVGHLILSETAILTAGTISWSRWSLGTTAVWCYRKGKLLLNLLLQDPQLIFFFLCVWSWRSKKKKKKSWNDSKYGTNIV